MIDLNKKYKTKCGKDVKLFEIHNELAIGIILFESSAPYPTMWQLNGQWYANSSIDFDLVEIFEPQSIWVNVYEDCSGLMISLEYGTKKEALINTHQFVGYIKTIEITNER